MEAPPAEVASTDGLGPLPPYEAINADRHNHQLQPEELPTLVLDETLIYSRLNKNRPLYKINSAPYEALLPKYNLHKIRYRASGVNGITNIRSREYHIYSIISDYVSIGQRGVNIFGHADLKTVFREIQMSQSIGPSSFKVHGYFKTDRSTKNRLQHGSDIYWRDTNDQIIAVETKVERNGEGNIRELPRLEIKRSMDEKILDLLVACWCARLWKQAEKELTEPISWNSIKKTIGRYSTRGNIWGGY